MTSPAVPRATSLKKQIEAGKYPGIVKTTLDGVDQRDYLEGTSAEVGARHVLLLHRRDPVGGAVQELEDLLLDGAARVATCGLTGAETFKWPMVDNIKRDPFEGAVGDESKTLLGLGGALAGPVTAYIYDWNIIPLGQMLWLKELESYGPFPPMQDPETYNLTQVIQQIKEQRATVTPATRSLGVIGD